MFSEQGLLVYSSCIPELSFELFVSHLRGFLGGEGRSQSVSSRRVAEREFVHWSHYFNCSTFKICKTQEASQGATKGLVVGKWRKGGYLFGYNAAWYQGGFWNLPCLWCSFRRKRFLRTSGFWLQCFLLLVLLACKSQTVDRAAEWGGAAFETDRLRWSVLIFADPSCEPRPGQEKEHFAYGDWSFPLTCLFSNTPKDQVKAVKWKRGPCWSKLPVLVIATVPALFQSVNRFPQVLHARWKFPHYRVFSPFPLSIYHWRSKRMELERWQGRILSKQQQQINSGTWKGSTSNVCFVINLKNVLGA